MKNDPTARALAELDGCKPASPEGLVQLARALESKANVVVAKAARLAGDFQLTELALSLANAFTRLLKLGTAPDKGCLAKMALARALNQLEHNDADLFIAGMKYRQPEPSWGGSEDTAAELRAICATGLVGSTCHFKLRELVDLLVDSEWPARAGAVRAIAAIGSEPASLLLRLKTLTGDPETEVMADCFSALLSIDGDPAIPLITSFAQFKTGQGDPILVLRDKHQEIREAAILALGASRRPEAVECLKQLFDRTADPDGRNCLLLSLATARTEPATSFLLDLIRDGSSRLSAQAASALQIQNDPKVQESIAQAIQARSSNT